MTSAHPVSRHFRARPPSESLARHAFTIGQMVKLLPLSKGRTSREAERTLYGSAFEVMRLMPESNATLYYRIRHTVTGQERVVSESDIGAAGDAAGA